MRIKNISSRFAGRFSCQFRLAVIPARLLLLVVACAMPLELAAQASVTTPKRGTQLRKDICDAFRIPMTKEVNGQRIVFVINTLNVMENWAFINCSLQLANGKQVDWSKTKYRSYAAEDDLENNAVGLLKKDINGNWSVVEHSFNHTDVVWIGWDIKYGFSKKLFE